jgi:hypothetical protein
MRTNTVAATLAIAAMAFASPGQAGQAEAEKWIND